MIKTKLQHKLTRSSESKYNLCHFCVNRVPKPKMTRVPLWVTVGVEVRHLSVPSSVNISFIRGPAHLPLHHDGPRAAGFRWVRQTHHYLEGPGSAEEINGYRCSEGGYSWSEPLQVWRNIYLPGQEGLDGTPYLSEIIYYIDIELRLGQ